MSFVINSLNCNDELSGSFFMPKSLSVAITVANVAFCRVCWRFAMRRSDRLSFEPHLMETRFQGLLAWQPPNSFRVASISLELRIFSRERVFLAHRLFTIAASCFVTLGSFFSSSIRPVLSSVRNSSLTSVWASVVAPSSLLVHRSSFTCLLPMPWCWWRLHHALKTCAGLRNLPQSPKRTHCGAVFGLWYLSPVGQFSRASGMGRCSQIWPKWVVSLPKSALNFTNATCILSSWPGGSFIWLSSPGRIFAQWAYRCDRFSVTLCVVTRACYGAKAR